MQKLKPGIRNLIIAGLMISVLIISELIYEIKNPYYVTQFTNEAGDYFLRKNSLKPAIFFLDLTAAVHTYVTSTRFPGKVRNLIVLKNLKAVDKSTEDEVLQLAKDRIGKIKKENNVQNLANFYYHAGLILFNKDYQEPSRNFFRAAVNLNPEMSFLFLELADSYFATNQKADGLSTLSYCLEFEPSKEHCQMFLKEYFENKTFFEVGHFSGLIDEFHAKK